MDKTPASFNGKEQGLESILRPVFMPRRLALQIVLDDSSTVVYTGQPAGQAGQMEGNRTAMKKHQSINYRELPARNIEVAKAFL